MHVIPPDSTHELASLVDFMESCKRWRMVSHRSLSTSAVSGLEAAVCSKERYNPSACFRKSEIHGQETGVQDRGELAV